MSNVSNTNNQDYRTAIVADVTPKEVLDRIAHVSDWWATHFEGSSQNLNDIFTVRFGNGDMYKIQISELVADKKIVWRVIDSYQAWVANVTEWTGTQIIWEFSAQDNGTHIEMTHMGLNPRLDCYDQCIQGWDYLLHKSLIGLLAENKGLPV